MLTVPQRCCPKVTRGFALNLIKYQVPSIIWSGPAAADVHFDECFHRQTLLLLQLARLLTFDLDLAFLDIIRKPIHFLAIYC